MLQLLGQSSVYLNSINFSGCLLALRCVLFTRREDLDNNSRLCMYIFFLLLGRPRRRSRRRRPIRRVVQIWIKFYASTYLPTYVVYTNTFVTGSTEFNLEWNVTFLLSLLIQY